MGSPCPLCEALPLRWAMPSCWPHKADPHDVLYFILLLQERLRSMCAGPRAARVSQSNTTVNTDSGTCAWRGSIFITLGIGNMRNMVSFFCMNVLPDSPSPKLCCLLQEDEPGQQAQWIKDTRLGNNIGSSSYRTSRFIRSFISGSLATSILWFRWRRNFSRSSMLQPYPLQ